MSAKRLLTLFVAATVLAGCASRQRSSSRIIEGDSPTIKYSGREAAGGPIGGR